MIGIRARFILSIGLAPLVLGGCGTAGSGTALKDSASLTPSVEQTNKQSAPAEASEAKAVPANKSKPDEKPQELPKPEAREAIVTAGANMPPVPVRRPYRKVRSKKPMAAKAKSATKAAVQKLVPTKTVAGRALPLNKTIASAPMVAKAVKAPPAEAPMVPVQVIPVQIMPSNAPQDIMDAFNEVPAPQKPAVEKTSVEKVAEAETVPIRHSFGQSDHRFTGQ